MISRRVVLGVLYALVVAIGLALIRERQKAVDPYVRKRLFPWITVPWTIDPTLVVPRARATFVPNHLFRPGDCVAPSAVPAVSQTMSKETCTGKYAGRRIGEGEAVPASALRTRPLFTTPRSHVLAEIAFDSPLIAATLEAGGVVSIHFDKEPTPWTLDVAAVLCDGGEARCKAIVEVPRADLPKILRRRRMVTFRSAK